VPLIEESARVDDPFSLSLATRPSVTGADGKSSGSAALRGLPLRLLGEGGVAQTLGAAPSEARDEARLATRLAARQGERLVFLEAPEIWAFQATDRLTFVHSEHGRFELDLSLVEIEASFKKPLVRVHRNWLVDIAQVRALERVAGRAWLFVGMSMDESRGVRVPVSRDMAHEVRQRLLADATGVRHGTSREEASRTP
jgi:DNA-binding LytR/AlgR family response regulator